MFALPRAPQERLQIAGGTYRLVRVFKHDFWAATCLYELERDEGASGATAALCAAVRRGEGSGDQSTAADIAAVAPIPKIVVKLGRVQAFCGIPLEWVGAWLRANEEAAYRLLAGVSGVPRWVGSFDATGYAVEYIDGRALDRDEPVPPGFFDRLRELFAAVHERGIAYTDSNKRSNILVGADGRPYLVDYQISVRRRDDLPWPLRGLLAAVVRYLQGKDLYHLYKHKRRLAPAELTAEEEELSRQRGGLHGMHRRFTKRYRSLRRRFLREQHAKGALQSPTADLEDYRMPEKDSWRK